MKPTPPRRDLSKRRYVYRLGADGRWSYGRNPMSDAELARRFFGGIRRDASGQYVVDCEGEICQVRVEDAPSFVDAVSFDEESGALAAVWITLASAVRERLDPASLETGRGGALYCTDSRGLRSRFRRGPHLDLARRIEGREGRYLLRVGGKEYEVKAESAG